MDESKKRNFFTHVFDFEDDSRHEMLNVAQYSVMAAVFVVLLNKGFELYMPEPEKDKGAAALALEALLQIVLTFLGLFFIHRAIEFLPTISGTKYGSYSMIPVILPTLLILLALNSGVGRKVAMVMDKVGGAAQPAKPAKQQAPSSPFSQLLPQGINTLANPMGQSAIPGPPANVDPDYNGMFAGNGEFEPVAANASGLSLF
jgi:hypothetical protein